MDSTTGSRRDTPIDALVRRLGPHAGIALRGHPGDDLSIDISGRGRMPFHTVGGSGTWLHRSGHAAQEIRTGNIVVLAWDCPHVLGGIDNGAPRVGGSGFPGRTSAEGVTLICGDLQIDPATRRLLRGTLTKVLVVATDAAQLDRLAQCLFAEAARGTPDSDPLLLRLVETLLCCRAARRPDPPRRSAERTAGGFHPPPRDCIPR